MRVAKTYILYTKMVITFKTSQSDNNKKSSTLFWAWLSIGQRSLQISAKKKIENKLKMCASLAEIFVSRYILQNKIYFGAFISRNETKLVKIMTRWSLKRRLRREISFKRSEFYCSCTQVSNWKTIFASISSFRFWNA